MRGLFSQAKVPEIAAVLLQPLSRRDMADIPNAKLKTMQICIQTMRAERAKSIMKGNVNAVIVLTVDHASIHAPHGRLRRGFKPDLSTDDCADLAQGRSSEDEYIRVLALYCNICGVCNTQMLS